MIRIRRSEERGHANYGWLDTYHTFSFNTYYDPAYMGFRALRVINDDRVAAGMGFGTHGHRDMEIMTYVLKGELAHKDSMGNGSTIYPGDVQRMSAGTGVRHSEFNDSKSEELHFLQIWLLPEREGIDPGYEQKYFGEEDKRGKLRLVASADGRDGSVKIHQDAELYTTVLGEGEEVKHAFKTGRYGYVQVARGSVSLNGEELREGDGAAVENESELTVRGANGEAEVLVFDLA